MLGPLRGIHRENHMNAHKLLVITLILPFLLTGCGDKEDKANVELSKDKMSITSKTDKGEIKMDVGGNVALPDNFPKDVFVYPDTKILSAIQMPQGLNVTMVSGDDKQNIIDTYQKKMSQNGWAMQSSMMMGAQSIMMFQKNDRAANITIVSGGDAEGVHISLTISNK